MGKSCAVRVGMPSAGSASDENRFNDANQRDGCTMGLFSEPKRKFWLMMREAYGRC